MCFSTRKTSTRASVAKNDIIVYKLFRRTKVKGIFGSPIKRLKWKRGIIQKAALDIKLLYKGCNITVGLHAFNSVKHAIAYGGDTNWVLLPVKVPKGSHYYRNKEQIVSSKMVLKSVVPIKF